MGDGYDIVDEDDNILLEVKRWRADELKTYTIDDIKKRYGLEEVDDDENG